MSTAGNVAVRLSSLCLDDRGRLRDFVLWDVAARGALLVDLALAGRLAHEDESVTVDVTPTGFDPADRLLAAIGTEPERSLDRWMSHGGVRLGDVAQANLASGRWTDRRGLVRRQYDDHSDEAADDRARDPRRPDPSWAPGTAAVMAIALSSGAVEPPPDPPDEALLALTGDLRWIVDAVVEHLAEAHRRNIYGAIAYDGAGSPYH